MTTPSRAPQRRPTFLQALVVTGAGIVLAFFGCLGAIVGWGGGGSNVLGTVGAAGFVIGLLAFLTGVVFLGIIVVRAIVWKTPGATPPAAGPPEDSIAIPPARVDAEPDPREGE